MLYFPAFGDNVEDRLGHGRFVIFYAVSGLIDSFAQIVVDPASQIPSVGASEAVAGIFSSYVLFFPKVM